MKKYIVLSFDDGRKDVYENAIPIMLQNNIKATINITTDFIEFPNKCGLFPNVLKRSMAIQNIIEISQKGFEIANHGAHHKNTIEDIEKANKKLKEWGISIENIGFASPYSEINEDNNKEIMKLVALGKIAYVRSGTQVKRERLLYKIAYILMEIIRSPYLFYFLNRRSIFDITKSKKFFKGITITKNTTLKQIKKLIEKMPSNTCIILNFHSILSEQEPGFKDKWVWDKNKFKKLCEYLKNTENLQVIRMIDLL